MTATLTLHRPSTERARAAVGTAGAASEGAPRPHAQHHAHPHPHAHPHQRAHPLTGSAGWLDRQFDRWAERADRLWREAGDPHRHRYF